MIEEKEPRNWQDLENRVAAILKEAGVEVSTGKHINTVRGGVNVDVWAYDSSATPSQIYLIECKQWHARVTKSVVHAFRTVVGDSGANWGAIISIRGFQKGAFEAAYCSNVRLLTWKEFQELYFTKWFERYFLPTVSSKVDPLIDYTEIFNTRIFRKADALSASRQNKFRSLRNIYYKFGIFCLSIQALERSSNLFMPINAKLFTPNTPLIKSLFQTTKINDAKLDGIPNSILVAKSFRNLMDAIISESNKAISEFDSVFCERA
jgi:hypothetical protein